MRRLPPDLGHRVLVSTFLALVSGAVSGSQTHAQDTVLEVLVEQIAGANIYLRGGTDDGISANDTLTVLNDAGDQVEGALFVISATATRSVVSFLADPFPLTRGTLLGIRVGPTSLAEGDTNEPGRPDTITEDSPPRAYPTVTGRLSLQLNTLGSTTKWLSNEEVSVDRRFTTPAVGLRLSVKDLPGGLEFQSNLRGSYRYSPDDLVQPAHSIRVYQTSLNKSFDRVPLQIQLGRFYNRYETYSGYWDGLLLRYGGRRFGAGVIAGYEPTRANEGFSTSLPKYTAFVDFSHLGERVGYYSDVSFHQQLPEEDLPDQTFFGWSQTLTIARTRVGTDVQVNRDTDSDTWSVTRLHANGSVPLNSRVSLLGRYAFDKPVYRYGSLQLPSFERQQASVGFRYWDRAGNASILVATNRFNEGDRSYSVSSSFGISRTRFLDLGFFGAGTLWLQEETRALNLLGGIDRVFGRVQTRASYRFYGTVGANSTLQSHTVDAALVLPLGSRTFSTITARIQRGRNQTSNGLFVSLWTSF